MSIKDLVGNQKVCITQDRIISRGLIIYLINIKSLIKTFFYWLVKTRQPLTNMTLNVKIFLIICAGDG